MKKVKSTTFNSDINRVPDTKCLSYLMYTWLIVYAILNLAYLKRYVYYISLIYSISMFFYVIYDYVTVTVTVTCDVMLTPNSKFKTENKK